MRLKTAFDKTLIGMYYAYHLTAYLRVKRLGLALDWTDFDGMIREWGLWERTYIPTGGLRGKTVLDIGMCCGGTGLLFTLAGAKKIIAIERDPDRLRMLRKNVDDNGWPVEVIGRSFEPSDLEIRRDFTKCDIEGYEMRLLENQTKIGPCSLEAHNWYAHDAFQARGFRELTAPDPMMGNCVMANWR